MSAGSSCASSPRLARKTLAGVPWMLLAAPPAYCEWSFEDVDATRIVYGQSSVALDALGRSVVAYSGNVLRVARWDGTVWQLEDVDSGACGYRSPSTAMDAAGNPAVSYYDVSSGSLQYARWNGTSWEIESVASGEKASLAFDRRQPSHRHRRIIADVCALERDVLGHRGRGRVGEQSVSVSGVRPGRRSRDRL